MLNPPESIAAVAKKASHGGSCLISTCQVAVGRAHASGRKTHEVMGSIPVDSRLPSSFFHHFVIKWQIALKQVPRGSTSLLAVR